MDAKRHRRWERAATHLRAALAEIELPDSHRGLVADFVDHDDLELAFEWTVEAIRDHSLALSTKARRHLSATAAELGLRANRDWQRIQLSDGRGV